MHVVGDLDQRDQQKFNAAYLKGLRTAVWKSHVDGKADTNDSDVLLAARKSNISARVNFSRLKMCWRLWHHGSTEMLVLLDNGIGDDSGFMHQLLK
eukprot:1992011-Karenia_brevis.AAC.1